MPDNDLLHRFVIENTRVRGEMVHLQASWQAVLERHHYPHNVRTILGEAFAACALLSATIKYDGSLILQIRGDGPLHLLVVQATSQGTLRGLARWHGDVPEHNLQDIFGQGQMAMTIEPADGEPYQGIIGLQGERIKDAIETYFNQSEQLHTRLWLASDETRCSGFLIQQMPATETVLPEPEQAQNDWQHAELLANTLSKDELLSLSTLEILHRLFHQEDIRLFEPSPLSFRCGCSTERIEQMILTLGLQEARALLEEQGEIKVDCEFCNAHYRFDNIDIETLFADNSQPDSTTQH
jgi:molecular chaperone Hsp33